MSTQPGPPVEVEREEEWRPVRGGCYEVSSLGRVRSALKRNRYAAGRHLTPSADGCGYLRVTISDGRKPKGREAVAALVAEAFIGPRASGMEVNHKDLDKTNNRPSNLEYLTHLENVRHGFAAKARRTFEGAANPNAKLSRDDVLEIRRRRACEKPPRYSDLAVEYGVTPEAIAKISRRELWASV